MEKLVVVLAIAALCGTGQASQSLLGSDRCTWGPGYWCQSAKTAKECGVGAVKHCQDKVWKTETQSATSVKSSVGSKVLQYSPFLVRDVPLRTMDRPSSSDWSDCLVCMTTFYQLKVYIDSTTGVTKASLKKLCSTKLNLAKRAVAKCEYLVERGFEQLKDKTNLDVPTLCKNLQRCDATSQTVSSALGAAVFGHVFEEKLPNQPKAIFSKPLNIAGAIRLAPGCVACELVVSKIDEELKKNKTDQEIEREVEKLCAHIPGKYSADCRELSRSYLPKFIKLIANEISPPQICAMAHLCKSAKLADSAVPKVRSKSATTFCPLCEAVVGRVQKMLEDKETQQEIFAEAEKLCQLLPNKEQQKQCDNFVKEKLMEAIDKLTSGVSPQEVCAEFDVCSTVVKAMPKSGLSSTPSRVSSKSMFLCPLCEMVVGKVQKFLEDKETQQEIVAKVEKLCQLLPNEEQQQQCNNFVKEKLMEAIDKLTSGVTPQEVCAEFGVCSTVVKAVTKSGLSSTPSRVSSKSMSLCPLCEMVVEKVQKFLEDKRTQQEIVTEAKKFCQLIPGEKQKQCDDFVEKNMVKIIEELTSGATPQEVCTKLHLCKAQVVPKPRLFSEPLAKSLTPGILALVKPRMFHERLAKSSTPGILALARSANTMQLPYCNICEMTVRKLQDGLESNIEEAKIRAGIKKLCSILPGERRALCEHVADAELEAVITKLKSGSASQQLCTDLHFCQAPKKATKWSFVRDDGAMVF